VRRRMGLEGPPARGLGTLAGDLGIPREGARGARRAVAQASRTRLIRGGQGRQALPPDRAGEPAGGAPARRFLCEQPRPLSEAERESIRHLAREIPALWHSSETTTAERKGIVRQIVER